LRRRRASMGNMGNGYGSAFHLLGYLGRHRQALNQRIQEGTSGRVVSGMDGANAFPAIGRLPPNAARTCLRCIGALNVGWQ
jgi:hypothetical protein